MHYALRHEKKSVMCRRYLDISHFASKIKPYENDTDTDTDFPEIDLPFFCNIRRKRKL